MGTEPFSVGSTCPVFLWGRIGRKKTDGLDQIGFLYTPNFPKFLLDMVFDFNIFIIH